MAELTEHERKIRTYIEQEIVTDDSSLKVDSTFPLLEGGVLDSMDVQRLILFVEESFDVVVPDELLVLENFENIRAISRLVHKLENAP